MAGGVGAVTLGVLANATGDRSTALGAVAQATGAQSLAVGTDAVASANRASAIGQASQASFEGSTALGQGAATTAANQVTLGGAGSSVRIGDIAASTAAQEGEVQAVTVDGNGTLGTTAIASAASVRTVRVAMDSLAAVTDAQFNALTGRVGALEGSIDSLFDLNRTLTKDSRQGIAAIAAQANPHFPSEAGKTSYASNVAAYRGEVGVSAGLMHRFEGDFALTAGASYGGGDNLAVKAGVAGEF